MDGDVYLLLGIGMSLLLLKWLNTHPRTNVRQECRGEEVSRGVFWVGYACTPQYSTYPSCSVGTGESGEGKQSEEGGRVQRTIERDGVTHVFFKGGWVFDVGKCVRREIAVLST
ncbi:hypothetical protein IWZ01DRAFT_148670 [Phyllosticta capitalensis]